MPDTASLDQFNRDLEALRREATSLREKARLTDVRSELDEIERLVGEMPGRIATARNGHYLLADEMERVSRDMQQRWWQTRSTVQQRMTQEVFSLEADLRSVEAQVEQLVHRAQHPASAAGLLAQAQAAAKGLAAKADTIERGLRSVYEPLQNEVRRFEALLDQVEWMMQQLAEASFALAPGESPIRAVKAVWAQGDKEDKNDPRGILYLTTQRLIFEQKQDVATKKVLFITTEKQRVQKLLIDVPLERISNAEGKKMGFMGHEDHFGVVLSPADPIEVARFHIDGQDCMLWQTQVMQARRGDLAALALA